MIKFLRWSYPVLIFGLVVLSWYGAKEKEFAHMPLPDFVTAVPYVQPDLLLKNEETHTNQALP